MLEHRIPERTRRLWIHFPTTTRLNLSVMACGMLCDYSEEPKTGPNNCCMNVDLFLTLGVLVAFFVTSEADKTEAKACEQREKMRPHGGGWSLWLTVAVIGPHVSDCPLGG